MIDFLWSSSELWPISTVFTNLVNLSEQSIKSADSRLK
jgi:hypothetical protein